MISFVHDMRETQETTVNYHETLKVLFGLLRQANMADSDDPERQPWQIWQDATQNTQWGLGYYGSIRNAIVQIAGEAITEHWAETNEIDFSLATRETAKC